LYLFTGGNTVAKISIASRRKTRQTFTEPSEKIITMVPQNLKPETDTQSKSTTEELAELFSKLDEALSQQEQIQFNLTLTRVDASKIKIDVNSSPNGTGKTILTSDEVCNMLKIKKGVLHKCVRMGIVPGLKVGREWRFEADSIFKLFREM